MSRIHFVGGEKGGIGKSVLARVLAQYHIDRSLPFAAFDTDRSHGALLRFYADYAQPIDLGDFISADSLMESAVADQVDVIVDLAAQTSHPLFDWMDDNDLLGLAAEEGVGVTHWHLLDDGADAIALLRRVLEAQGDRLDHVIVKNLGRGKDFSMFEASDAKAAAMERGAHIMELPELHAGTMRKIDHGNLSFWAAGNNRSAGLTLMERQRTRVWVRRVYEQLDAIGGGLFTKPAPTLVVDNTEVVEGPAS
jgi:hypothetical protein